MITLLLLACTPSGSELGSRTDPVVLPPDTVEPFAPEVRAELDARAPDFALESADGIFHLGSHAGDVILLDLSGFT